MTEEIRKKADMYMKDFHNAELSEIDLVLFAEQLVHEATKELKEELEEEKKLNAEIKARIVRSKTMNAELEKEAEKYAQDMAMYYESAHDFIPSQFEKYLREAVKYGYNKANEWHKYSERPKKKINALCFDIGQNRLILGFYDIESDEWVRYGGYEIITIDLWKEIVLPEIKE